MEVTHKVGCGASAMGCQLMTLRQMMASVLIGGAEVQKGIIGARVVSRVISGKGGSGTQSVLMKSEHQTRVVTNA